ncbi:hypothetical protein DKP76_07060 [Falsochrobactrum shanghaiense]|uniref:Uncharacterized protein n=1 Tax=Falsochrobactrum shanghaiense TaxID=2201899 RepID=A0A316JBT0_9HYPH|nr:hypothetical protein [Falsochrobactrum shanghaiense]PWL18816.1 hypothetical protein DKP76_07060 [Falsochrobactrum shanghaiense]
MAEDTKHQVQVEPLAALNETYILAEFYKNRNLILANENMALRKQIEAMQAAALEGKPLGDQLPTSKQGRK